MDWTFFAANGFQLTIPKPCRDFAGRFLVVVDQMRELAGDDPNSVRCVFEFSY